MSPCETRVRRTNDLIFPHPQHACPNLFSSFCSPANNAFCQDIDILPLISQWCMSKANSLLLPGQIMAMILWPTRTTGLSFPMMSTTSNRRFGTMQYRINSHFVGEDALFNAWTSDFSSSLDPFGRLQQLLPSEVPIREEWEKRIDQDISQKVGGWW